MACLALVIGLPDAIAQSSETERKAPARVESGRSHDRKARAKGRGEREMHKRSARATRSAVRERQLTRLRERRPLTPEEELVQDLDAVWTSRMLRQGTTAVYVVDAVSGKPLYAVHEDQALNPASNVKLVATATALDVLGPEWRYVTRVLGPTPSADGSIRGDLYLLGSYDPTLEADDITALADELAASGVTHVDGDLYVGAGLSGDDLRRDSVRDPRIAIRVDGAATPGQPATVSVSPAMDLVRVDAQVQTVKRGAPRISITSELVDDGTSPAYWRVVVSGRIRVGRKATYRRTAPRPQLFTAHLLRAALVARGVIMTGSVRQLELADYVARATTYLPVDLARHESEPLRDLIARINKRSINDLADRLIMTVGAARFGGPPTMQKGVQAMYEWLQDNAGIDPGTVHLDTGSGLSYRTELSARHIVRVLRQASGYRARPAPRTDTPVADADSGAVASLAATGGGELAGTTPGADAPATDALDTDVGELEQVFRESLAIAGVDGTLSRRFRGSSAHGKVLGKTGTLTRIIALAGIVEDTSGALAFAIVTNGTAHRKRNLVRKQHEAMVEAMQRYLRARQAIH